MRWLQEQINHWKVVWIVIITIVCLIVDKALRWYIIQHPPLEGVSQELWILPIRFLILMVWFTVIGSLILQIYYLDKTGRNYFSDRRDHNIGFFELLRFYNNSDPYKMDVSKLPFKDWRGVNGIILGKVGNRLIYRDTEKNRGEGVNALCIGLPGSGKTSSIVIPTCLRFGGSVFAIDIKGDILAATKEHRNIKVFAPLDRSSCHYDPLSPLRNMDGYDKGIFLEQTSEVLIPDDGSADGKYFIETARSLFCGISGFLLNENPNISLPDIARQIVEGDVIEWISKVKNSDVHIAKKYTDSLYGSSEKNVSGAYGELAKAVRPFCDGTLATILTDDGNCISTQTLEEGYDVYIEIPQESIGQLSPITSLVVQNFMTAFMKRPDLSIDETQRPVILCLDEFPQLHLSYEVLSAGLSLLRAKKLHFFIAMQSIGQLIKRYGDDGMREITDTMRYFAILSAQDPGSREWCQQLIGKRKILKQTYSESEGIGQYGFKIQTGKGNRVQAEDEEYIFKSEDFGNLGDDLIIYADGKYIKAEKCFWFK